MVKQLYWTIQGTAFTFDMLLLPLGCCDLVLGIEWLITLGDITWNFEKLIMQFFVKGMKFVMCGSSKEGLKTVRRKQLEKIIDSGVHISMLHVCTAQDVTLLHSLTTHASSSLEIAQIAELLLQFQDIFLELTTLPPNRVGHAHRIPLVHDALPVNKRPYRYAKQQKYIIDRLVQEYLKSGVIQISSSSYASPVVLVSKKDGTWRLCVNYRDLNKQTVKDIFPIPLVGDLLDEVHGSTLFSKINLRAGYNQVTDVHKTAFRTHVGHFEYLVCHLASPMLQQHLKG